MLCTAIGFAARKKPVIVAVQLARGEEHPTAAVGCPLKGVAATYLA
jgi:hypothetical protein